MVRVALGGDDLGEWTAWLVVSNSRKNDGRSQNSSADTEGKNNLRGCLETRRKTARGMGLGRTHSKRTRRTEYPQEAALPHIQNARRGGKEERRETRSPVCAIHASPHVSDSPGSVRLQCLDIGPNRRAFLDSNERSVCSP